MIKRSCAAFLTCLLASSAQSGAWEEFEQRCLLAYENGAAPVTTGLKEVELPGLMEGEVAFFGLTGNALMVLETAPADATSACRVFYSQTEETQRFTDWLNQQLSKDRYVPDEETDGSAAVSVLSNVWIEPVIGVQWRENRGGFEFRVLETDLES